MAMPHLAQRISFRQCASADGLAHKALLQISHLCCTVHGLLGVGADSSRAGSAYVCVLASLYVCVGNHAREALLQISHLCCAVHGLLGVGADSSRVGSAYVCVSSFVGVFEQVCTHRCGERSMACLE